MKTTFSLKPVLQALAAIALVLAFVWASLYFYKHGVTGINVNTKNEFELKLRTLDAANKNWDVALYRVQSDLHADYLQGNQQAQQAKRDFGAFAALSGKVGSPALDAAVQKLANALDAKATLTAQFLEQNKALRASVDSLPGAVTSAQEKIRQETRASVNAIQTEKIATRLNALGEQLLQPSSAIDRYRNVSQSVFNFMNEMKTATSSFEATKRAIYYTHIDALMSQLLADSLRYYRGANALLADSIRAELTEIDSINFSSLKLQAIKPDVQMAKEAVNTILALRIKQAEMLGQIEALKIDRTINDIKTIFTQDFDARLAEESKVHAQAIKFAILTGSLMVLFIIYFVISLATSNRRLAKRVAGATEELHRAQAMLIANEKMAQMGDTAATMAHEINTPLACIISALQTMRENMQHHLAPLFSGIDELMDAISADGKTAKPNWHASLSKVRQLKANIDSLEILPDIIRDLGESEDDAQAIGFTIENVQEMSRVDMAKVENYRVENSANIVIKWLHSKAHHAKVVTAFGNTPTIRCNPGHLHQIFQNLIKNALQAAPRDGSGVVTVATDTLDAKTVRISVTDNCGGIPTDHLPMIFEGGFTTKGDQGGTGRGLSIVKRIVENYRGTITVQTKAATGNDKGGTSFLITLPVDAKVKG